MTTTADKIKNLETRIINLTNSLVHFKDAFNLLQSDFEQMKMQEPPDPEPLECWAALNEHGDALWLAKDKTKASGADITTILMREVTPQMEQDQLNARRYRQAKREAAEGTRGSLFWTMPHVCVWDREFDKAMEES